MGQLYALLAALCNSTIGIFATLLIYSEIEHTNIAFYRCATALLFTTAILLLKGNFAIFSLKKKEIIGIGIAAFWGMFVLYTFEIWAIAHASISLVSFFIYSSGIFTLILAVLFLNEKLTLQKSIASVLVLAGLCAMAIGEHSISLSLKGAILALIAGLGYALFLFFMKKNSVQSGLTQLWWLFLFGTIYLAFPFFNQTPALPQVNDLPAIITLAIIPTIGGFYCTCKALELLEASKVQLLEMSEPLFATFLAFVIFSEQLSSFHYVGISFILFGLIYLESSKLLTLPMTIFRKTT